MKNLFHEYNELDVSYYKELWSNALFIFDTNVLLNVYRYEKETRSNLFDIIESLNDRIWIPFHVGIEFHRNRMNVINQKKNKFKEVSNFIEKIPDYLEINLNNIQRPKSQSFVEVNEIKKDFQKVINKHIEKIKDKESDYPDFSGIDSILERIYEIFHEKIGEPPKDQKDIDTLSKEASVRYSNRIPPGYEDDSKEKLGYDSFSVKGIIYEKKYGDYLIWSEILDYAKREEVNHIIFVTDDDKEDWWQKIPGKGKRKIGPRVELREEIKRVSGVDYFHMYNTENFLRYAKREMHINVKDSTINEVVDLEKTKMFSNYLRGDKIELKLKYYYNAIFDWLSIYFSLDNSKIINIDTDTVQIITNNGSICCSVVLLKNINELYGKIEDKMVDSYLLMEKYNYDQYYLIIGCVDEASSAQVLSKRKNILKLIPKNFRIIVGNFTLDRNSERPIFEAKEDFAKIQ